MQQSDIIVAISTPAGVGGIAVIRLSGKGCIGLVDTVYRSPSGKKLIDQKANTIHFGTIVKDDAALDEVLVSVFHNPSSFTGEDSVEISCHGSIYIQQGILQLLLEKGARLATAGEFTQRAFLNGKMDLSQAESVADLIASTSAATHRLALNQMRGGFSNKLVELRTDLLNFASLIELELDFSEEDVEFANRDNLKQLASHIHEVIEKLADSFSLGNVVKTGIPVAIIGETNAGKSTLLNLLLREEKAIVSDIHGTTRDVIEDTINIDGLIFRLIDTAGIRDTDDVVESLGIERTFKKLEQANIVLWVVDAETEDERTIALSQKILPLTEGKKLILVFNKVDIIPAARKEYKEQLLSDLISDRIFISAKYHQGTENLQDILIEAANIPEFGEQDVIVTNMRHYEALRNALAAITRVSDGMESGLSSDFLAQDIRECMHYLGEITGQISTDDILGNIFSKFCIGK
ncbi:tRNA uridine-5-carboxymethylaminomethyl(34) synthesis GTPase MnmE [Dysgonomonas sp. HGC4]|uniref:tRNA uridine-5-carboxymethylaminomethyl(34) synthesis GTPase MnmE n=1 Tax=Dysgonomonas sp. HGC4 TaxID=1658009 RepID=UPI0006819C19|nr:tRNA uridine-5-carboxymethylaminomethyl(34) synthesis GTPase MnmE [Dysgonomonas sp. HGC4]MBD8349774.1 tRNA uridine-5-carboxymethylaminomethyl(34) synthesis GTPase MnmE [Dysgonomonas sp. HGC4]